MKECFMGGNPQARRTCAAALGSLLLSFDLAGADPSLAPGLFPPQSTVVVLAGPIADAFNLAAISLRLGGRRLLFESAAMKVTNVPKADKYMTRDYRPGWELLA